MIKIFHTPKPHKFSVPYRFYDPQKEEMQERETRIKKELGLDEAKAWSPSRRIDLHGQFRSSMRHKVSDDAKRSATTRLLVLIAILALLAYFVLYF